MWGDSKITIIWWIDIQCKLKGWLTCDVRQCTGNMWFGSKPGACTNVSALTNLGICECLWTSSILADVKDLCTVQKRPKGASLQEYDRERVSFPRIGLTLFEQHQEKGIRAYKISRLSTITPTENYLYLWSRISPSHANFLLPYSTACFHLQNFPSIVHVAFAVSQL